MNDNTSNFSSHCIYHFFSCAKEKVFTEKDIQIIPKPAELKLSQGIFEFSKETKFVISNSFQKKLQRR